MIRYNWELIKKHTNNDISRILKYFNNIYVLKDAQYNFLINNKWAVNIHNSKEPKPCFLLNVDALMINAENALPNEQYVYLDLASRRDFFTYMNSKGRVTYLPTWKIEGVYDINKLKTNRLLMIENNNIYFIHEGD